ncbi:MAG: hypothetical protein ACM359_02110 [Bacillota bacterium]
MAEIATLMTCSIGGNCFQIDDYEVASAPDFRLGILVGHKVTVAGQGYVAGTDASDFAAQLRATQGAFRLQGQDCVIKGLGGQVEFELLAANCLGGGPYVSFRQLANKSGAALSRRFEFTISSDRDLSSSGGSSGQEEDSDPFKEYAKATTTETPNGLRKIQWEGQKRGTDMAGYYDQLLASIRAAYGWPAWTLTGVKELNAAGDELKYTVAAEELAEPLPSYGDLRALEGEASTLRERDERGRLLVTYAYDFAVAGDPYRLYAMLRPDSQTEGLPLRERFECTTHKEVRMRASFTLLRSAEGDDLLEWDCALELDQYEALARAEPYEGIGVQLVYTAAEPYRITLRGRAVGLAAYPKEPAMPNLAEQGYLPEFRPKIRLNRVNRWEYETTWAYGWVGSEPPKPEGLAELRRLCERPEQPEFY